MADSISEVVVDICKLLLKDKESAFALGVVASFPVALGNCLLALVKCDVELVSTAVSSGDIVVTKFAIAFVDASVILTISEVTVSVCRVAFVDERNVPV